MRPAIASLIPPALLCLALGTPAQAKDVKNIPGSGRVTAEKSTFSQAKENQKALDKAQQVAVHDAIKATLAEVFGHDGLDPLRIDAMARDLADRSSAFVLDTQVKESAMDGLTAKVQVMLRVDLDALRAHLKRSGISLTQGMASRFKFVVLSYSVEGMDANLNKPIVLRDEIRAESSSLSTRDESVSARAAVAVEGERSATGVRVGRRSATGVQVDESVRGAAAASLDASRSSVDAQAASYYRVVEYADPTKKGLAQSNEIRALLAGALQRSDLKLATIEAPMAGMEFRTEDEFVNKVLASVRKHAEVQDDDCVVIALNSLTPVAVARGQKYTSRVTVHFVRVKDGTNLMPSDSVAKASAVLSSADEARTQAVQLCVATLKDGLSEQVRTLMQNLRGEAAVTPQAQAGVYTIEISNLQDRSVLVRFKQWLRQQQFTFKSDARAGGTVEVMTLTLGDKSPEEIKDVLDGMPQGFELLSKTDSGAKLKVR